MWAQDQRGAQFTPNSLQRVRVGAARALRIVDFEGRTLQGILSEPKWETRGGGLFFTREADGTRNIWRAFPDPRDSSRYPQWTALPVTQFAAPLFASGACPLEGDRALLMLSNAANPRGAAQATLFDLINPSLRALTAERDGVLGVAPAPDASVFAFTAATRGGRSSGQKEGIAVAVWQQNLLGRPALPELVRRNAWRPAWQSEKFLLVESVPDNLILRLPLGDSTRAGERANIAQGATQIAVGSQLSASRDGSILVLAGKSGGASPLYLLSGDGSGLVALSSTEGAQSPALSGDGRFLAFVAPLGEGNARALWIVPLQPGSAPETKPLPLSNQANAPVAQIRSVQNATRGALAIWGVADGAGVSATLEIGQGTSPTRWEAWPIILPLAPNAPLLVWNPPPSARGVWNFRLAVSGPGGAAQSLLTVRLPLQSRRAVPRLPSLPSLPAGGPLPSLPLPDLPAAPPQSALPLPPLLPAPPPRLAPPRLAPPRLAPSGTVPSPPRAPTGPSASNGTLLLGGDAATFNVSNTLAQIKAGQSLRVTFWALNRGARAWNVAPSRDGMVRLVTRWVRFDTGNRNGWTYQTMKTPVTPGARTRWDFDLVAPAQPGRYKLIYALQRVAPNWTPPAYNAPQETWPDDFAAIAFAVTVKP